jgi:uncharacterized protein YjbJ (UPF0337 family)
VTGEEFFMPKEKSKEDLPESVKNVLPSHAQEIYKEAHERKRVKEWTAFEV